MSPRFILGRENVPCVAEVVNRSLKADCTDSSSSFHMFIYARSEQCDLGPIYTITNTQRISIYPSKLKFILVKKISPDLGCLHQVANMPKKTKLYSRFSLLRLYPDSPVHTSTNIPYSDLSSYAVNLPG